MSIPKSIKIKNSILPASPGVYLMKDSSGKVIYVGKASMLRTRVGSYFSRPQNGKVYELIKEIKSIDYIRVKTVVEALILEAEKIKELWPKYNVLQKDDRSFIYLVITKDKYPKLLLMRGHELHQIRSTKSEIRNKFQIPNSKFKRVFGPFLSPNALRAALNILRKSFPWSDCEPPKIPNSKFQILNSKPCFDYHLKKCPGVCVGAISPKEYKKNIRGLILFFEGKKGQVIRGFKKEMAKAVKEERFEDAAKIRNRLYALENIRDISALTRDAPTYGWSAAGGEANIINIYGRIEGYDISNISGTSAVGSMVVFSGGEPDKSQYRKFRIKTVKSANDTAMLREVLTRRFAHRGAGWELPEIILIDGGVPQVNAAKKVLEAYHLGIPIVGIAKGVDRKKDELILPKDNPEMARVANQFKDILVAVRDEAHRFAIAFYRRTHRRKLIP
ncbi:UvrB/UvrC motif-containing protein [Candidatus Uhrbacteria bacterium]|nr:UvrB/UvrC motif-containing protein [Candidatus Uhrbacteria bacterium]